jgi:sterol desaturase/sphingolipid hydroxylase (fatty acid hydroxylase superfamily)
MKKTRIVNEPAAGAVAGPQAVAWAARAFGAVTQRVMRLSATRANSRAGLVADFAVSIALIAAGLRYRDLPLPAIPLLLVCGLLLFSFVEYGFHRWLFHGPVRLMEEGHRKHHEHPLGYDSLPFFLSPLLMLALAGVLATALRPGVALLLAGAVAAGYAMYGLGHVVIHARRFRHPLARRWAAAHHVHHCHPRANFGVTSPLWDIVLGTRHVSAKRARGS